MSGFQHIPVSVCWLCHLRLCEQRLKVLSWLATSKNSLPRKSSLVWKCQLQFQLFPELGHTKWLLLLATLRLIYCSVVYMKILKSWWRIASMSLIRTMLEKIQDQYSGICFCGLLITRWKLLPPVKARGLIAGHSSRGFREQPTLFKRSHIL